MILICILIAVSGNIVPVVCFVSVTFKIGYLNELVYNLKANQCIFIFFYIKFLSEGLFHGTVKLFKIRFELVASL